MCYIIMDYAFFFLYTQFNTLEGYKNNKTLIILAEKLVL